MTGWADALDRFEERLGVYRSVLETGDEPSVRSWPPDDLTDSGIPPDLLPRAQALLAQALQLEEELAAARSARHLPVGHGRRRRALPGRPTISAEL